MKYVCDWSSKSYGHLMKLKWNEDWGEEICEGWACLAIPDVIGILERGSIMEGKSNQSFRIDGL